MRKSNRNLVQDLYWLTLLCKHSLDENSLNMILGFQPKDIQDTIIILLDFDTIDFISWNRPWFTILFDGIHIRQDIYLYWNGRIWYPYNGWQFRVNVIKYNQDHFLMRLCVRKKKPKNCFFRIQAWFQHCTKMAQNLEGILGLFTLKVW